MEKGRKTMYLLPFCSSVKTGFVSLSLLLGAVAGSMPMEMNAQSTARVTSGTQASVVYRGVVIDEEGEPLPGVTVRVKDSKGLGVATDIDGNFSLPYNKKGNVILQFTYIGMKPQELRVTNHNKPLTVRLQPDDTQLKEVVVNGIYTRNIESFTGSVSTFSKDDLKMVGSTNILKSLSALDPSIIMPDNNLMGSDPNTLPEITINGKMNPQTLAQEYETDPNQPLFILDGFETTLQTINDLNMDRIESISILKDASATAIYGSKAANGVIVVETKKPEAGRLQLSYNGSLQVAWADLSDYNLMNAEQKLQYELLAGEYGVVGPDGLPMSEENRALYFDRLRLVKQGYNTYWLSEPLRTATTQTHNVYIQGGDQSFRYGAGLSYNNTQGVMKGSDRDVINGNISLTYRVDNFNFTNQTTIANTKANNETVSFSEFSQMNPFYAKYADNGEAPKYVYRNLDDAEQITVWNPVWDMLQNSFRKSQTTSITDNFQFDWRATRQLRIRGNFQYQLVKGSSESFVSPNETSQANLDVLLRGRYSNTTNTMTSYSGRVNASYGAVFGLNTINAVAGLQFSENSNRNYGFTAQGYTDDKFWNPNFSNGYPTGGKPSSTDSKSRSASYYGNLNYAYDMRYLLDFNFSHSGASQFGIDNPFTSTWSIGAGWNMHSEEWLKDNEFVSYLKPHFSYGNPGNQNYDAKLASSIYSYLSGYSNPFGLAAFIAQWGNSGLKWQKTKTYNWGVNATLFNNRLSISADYQIRKSDPQLVRIDLPGSTGVTSAPMNVGGTDNRSISFNGTFYLVRKPNFNWYVSANMNHYTTTYYGVGDILEQFNESGRASTSLLRMFDGGSTSGLYAVRSLGIDPATGNEIFMTKNGAPTYQWSSDDEVLVGDSNPDLTGNINTSLVYHGFTFAASFSVKLGEDVVLQTLMDKVENISSSGRKYNQDLRALTDRWQKPGDIAKYKRIDDTTTSHVTTRFIATENTFTCSSINFGYRTSTAKFLDAIHATSFDVRFYMNDIFRISNIKQERGTKYPFQRSFSMAFGLSF